MKQVGARSLFLQSRVRREIRDIESEGRLVDPHLRVSDEGLTQLFTHACI